MEIIVRKSDKIPDGTAVALGNFDGLHIGHQSLIKEVIKRAKDKGYKSCVFTFNSHTASKINDKNVPKLLTNNSQKIKILENMGTDILYMIDFDEDIMKMSPKDFITDILLDKLNAKLIVVGFNYRFGYKASGDVELLKKIARGYDIDVIVIEPVVVKKNIVSSTYIRELLSKGFIKEANILLGRAYSITGNVVKGKGRGKSLGFPTANIATSENFLIPRGGVYITKTNYYGDCYLSVTNVGKNPTFNGEDVTIETHILDFNCSIYDSKIEIFFIEYLREECKFDNKEDLVKQVFIDIEMTKRFK